MMPVGGCRDVMVPLLRSISNVSTVPSNRWSPDHSTPILLHFLRFHNDDGVSGRLLGGDTVVFALLVVGEGGGEECPWDCTYHRNQTGKPWNYTVSP